MTAKEFAASLRELLDRKPFLPFTIEYNDGRQVWVDAPYVAHGGGGGAGYLGPNEDIYLFDYKTVKRFIPVVTETKQ